MGSLWNDVRYAARSLSRSPGFTLLAIVTIALGIGVNAGVFTVLNGVLFRDLHAPDARDLVSITMQVDGVRRSSNAYGTVSTPEYLAYRERTQTFVDVLAHSDPTGATLGGDTPRQIGGVIVSCNYFDVLRQPPVLGRALAPKDCAAGAEPVVVLGHEFWTTALGADRAAVGRTVELNRRTFVVAGVAAPGTYGGSTPVANVAFFAPIGAQPILRGGFSYEEDWYGWLLPVGRLREGASLAQARAELGVFAAQLDQAQPGRSTRLTVERARTQVVPLFLRGFALTAGAVLMGAFGLILLIACANVADLLLARGTGRAREIGVRLSLGASRARVIRQLLAESVLIALAGGVLGSALALWSFQGLVTVVLPPMLPPWMPLRGWDARADLDVVVFALALTLGTGLFFGLAPALTVSKPDLHAVIKQDSAGAGGSRRGGRLRGTLVGMQVALCMTLMIGAGLLLRGLYSAHTIDPGFEYRSVGYVSLEPGRGYGAEETAALRRRVQEQVEALPGIAGVTHAMQPPFGNEYVQIGVRLPGESEERARFASYNVVRPSYFSLLEIPLLRGRTFTQAEVDSTGEGPTPAIVSAATARNFWPGAEPLGQTLLWDERALQVVGVVADAQVSALGQVDPYYVYTPGGSSLIVKSTIDFATTAASIRSILRTLDPNVVATVRPLEEGIVSWRARSGSVTALGAGLGILALVLAAVGIYGVVSYAVTRRYREIGIRMALGASAAGVLGVIFRQTMRPVAVGAVLGIAGASAASGVLSSVLFGVSPVDPVGLVGSALFVLGVAVAAGVLAARPATRVDPSVSLRYE